MEWARLAGFYDVTPEQLEDPMMMRSAQPQVSGVGRYGHTVSLRSLASSGAHILGRFEAVHGDQVNIGGNVLENIQFGDKVSEMLKGLVDKYLETAGITPPPLEFDPADEPDPEGSCAEHVDRVDLKETGISSVIWSSGFKGDFSWLQIPDCLDNGEPVHDQGVATVPGVFFLGLPWLRKRQSGIILGIDEDAAYITEQVLNLLADNQQG